jgi:hypothetical protein
MSINLRGRKLRLTAATVALAALSAVGAYHTFKVTPAQALTRKTICARDLYVRSAPAGAIIGTLFTGNSFDVERYSPSGDWVYGYAWGHVNAWGWVQNGWFC